MVFDRRLDLDNPNLFLDLVQMRKERKKDSVIIIVGERRSGKSFSAIKLAEKICERNGKKFDVRTNLFFEPIDFLKRFNEIEDDVIILDEASEHIDRRSWWDIQNKIFSSLITREGFRRNVVILTFPVLSDLDKRAIRLSSHLVTMFGIDHDKQISYGMAYKLKLYHLKGEIFPQGIQMLRLSKATEHNIEEYSKMKVEWNKGVSDTNIAIMEEIENPKPTGRKFNYSVYVKMFHDGLIDHVELKNYLLELNFREKDVDMLILSEADAKLRREDEENRRRVKELEREEKELLDGLTEERPKLDNPEPRIRLNLPNKI